MNKDILARMARATELTRTGRLAEATALIQRALGKSASDATPPTGGVKRGAPRDDVIDANWVDVTEAVAEPESMRGATATATPTPDVEAERTGGGLKEFLRSWRRRGADAPAAAPRPSAPVDAGEFIAGLYANEAGERAYKLYVPSGGSAGQALPLIVMLHGCTQGPDDFAAGTRMNALGEQKRCFVLYPAQANSANHSRCWNWFRREDQTRGQGEPSILAGMTRDVIQRYGLDPRRVYVAGLSAGGAMAAVMAVTYPELYAAVGIHSGLACGSAHDLPSALAAMRGMPSGIARSPELQSHSTPTIVFHGDRDRTVHPRNGEDVIARSAHQQNGNAGRSSSEPGRAPGGLDYTRTVHRDPTGRVLLEHWLVHRGGHAWFGGSQAGSYTDPRGPDASAEMVRFFLDT